MLLSTLYCDDEYSVEYLPDGRASGSRDESACECDSPLIFGAWIGPEFSPVVTAEVVKFGCRVSGNDISLSGLLLLPANKTNDYTIIYQHQIVCYYMLVDQQTRTRKCWYTSLRVVHEKKMLGHCYSPLRVPSYDVVNITWSNHKLWTTNTSAVAG